MLLHYSLIPYQYKLLRRWLREKILNHETRYNITRDIFVIYIFKSWISFWSQKPPLIISYLHSTYFQTITKKSSTRIIYTLVLSNIFVYLRREYNSVCCRQFPTTATIRLFELGTPLDFTNIKTPFNFFEHYFVRPTTLHSNKLDTTIRFFYLL